MSEEFNPYRKWLGVPEGIDAPNCYQLLGVSDFESDPEVIAVAADRQMLLLRSIQNGPRAALVQQLLNEVAAARVTLLNPENKLKYDDFLGKNQDYDELEESPEVPQEEEILPPVNLPPARGLTGWWKYMPEKRRVRYEVGTACTLAGILVLLILLSAFVHTPEDENLYVQAETSFQKHQYNEARGFIERALELKPGNIKYQNFLLSLEAREKAYSTFQKAQDFLNEQNLEQALKFVDRALVLEPENTEFLQLKTQIQNMIQKSTESLQESEKRVESLQVTVQKAIDEEDFLEAETQIKNLLKETPKDSEALELQKRINTALEVTEKSPQYLEKDGLFLIAPLKSPLPDVSEQGMKEKQPFRFHLRNLYRQMKNIATVQFTSGDSSSKSGTETDSNSKSDSLSNSSDAYQCTIPTTGLCSIVYSPDGKQFAVGGAFPEFTIHVFSTSGTELCVLKGHSDAVTSLVYLPDGQTLVSGSWDGTIRFWDLKKGKELDCIYDRAPFVSHLALSPDGSLLASSGGYGKFSAIRLWNVQHRSIVRLLAGHESSVWETSFSPDGSQLVSVGEDETIRFWDLEEGKCVHSISAGEPLYCVQYAPNGKSVVTAGKNCMVKQWNVQTFVQIHSFPQVSNEILALAFSPDGTRIAAAGASSNTNQKYTVCVWNTITSEIVLETANHHSPVSAICFSPDSNTLLTTSPDRTIWVLNQWKSMSYVPLGTEEGQLFQLSIDGIDYRFRWCPAGTFQMGPPDDSENPETKQEPKTVEISQGFWLLETEVTQAQWKSIMGSASFGFKGATLPVESVSWNDCMTFCRKLSAKIIGGKVMLPTEAEWEYACRAGTNTPFSFGEALNGTQANCDGRYPFGTEEPGPYLGKTCKCASYPPNPWGLYDMHGNVWEWCANYYEDWEKIPESVTDPQGPKKGVGRVYCGGGWSNFPKECRSAQRLWGKATYTHHDLGFRIKLCIANREKE